MCVEHISRSRLIYVRYCLIEHYVYDDLMIAHMQVFVFNNYGKASMFCSIDCN